MEFLGMVNLNIVPQSLFDFPEEWLFTFWVYLQKADNTKARDVVLASLQKALSNVPPPVPEAPNA
jgi:hypothetical protein